jgi:hypothetical protein
VDLSLSSITPGHHTVTISLWANAPGEGAVLATSSTDVTVSDTLAHRVRFTFNDLALSPGSVYAIGLTNAGGDMDWMGVNMDTYPAGMAFGCTQNAIPGSDMDFTTWW